MKTLAPSKPLLPGGVIDPLQLASICWPNVTFYREQRKVIYSVIENDKTFVPAGNMLGKDFVAAFITLWFFVSRHPVRVVTTSVDGIQLEGVLWGEIRRFIQESQYQLPIVQNHLHLKKIARGKVCGISYMIGRVAAKGEGMLGHHVAQVGDGLPRTLFVADEASGVDNKSWERAETWADRMLAIGNPYPCTNFFKQGVKRGDVPHERKDKPGLYSKVIRIKAEDSPSVRLGIAQEKAGLPPSYEQLVPGVLPYDVYLQRRVMWDEVRQCIGLDGVFYEGVENLLFPPVLLNEAESRETQGSAITLGIDPGEGVANTCWCAANHTGIVYLLSLKTPDTSQIVGRTIGIMQELGVSPSNVFFDTGGGGKQHADTMRALGYPVNDVAFGESVTPPPRRGMVTLQQREAEKHERYAFKNRRIQMYWRFRERLQGGFALPQRFAAIRQQLAPLPLLYDGEGRLYLPPKNRRNPRSTEETLIDIIGHSPDEADAAALAVYGLDNPYAQARPGAIRTSRHR